MDAEALKALFEPFGPVTVKRMFGGSGIYAEGLCFAIESGGEVFL
ncbi:MAG TPA: TfoX/Sxy family protein, partial [Roseiarcus sp.]